jgi:hypothetical protein
MEYFGHRRMIPLALAVLAFFMSVPTAPFPGVYGSLIGRAPAASSFALVTAHTVFKRGRFAHGIAHRDFSQGHRVQRGITINVVAPGLWHPQMLEKVFGQKKLFTATRVRGKFCQFCRTNALSAL